MLRTRDDVYQPGLPAAPGEHYGSLVRFALEYSGESILDLGCGYGAYSLEIAKRSRRCVGCDINLQYLGRARSAGLQVVAADSGLPFLDKSFDTVILFEVIEHVPAFETLLAEAFRVARKNVLITVPNSEDIDLLQQNDVTFAHMLSSDHVHFFDPESLEGVLRRVGSQVAGVAGGTEVTVRRGDPLYPFWFVRRSSAYYALRVLYRLGLLKPRFFSRLYAVAGIRQN